jgi:hypothetical protein
MEKTGDETVDSMFDEIIETRVAPDGTLEANLKPDDAQEMELAVAEMQAAWKDFHDINADGGIAAWGYAWWKALMLLSCAENRLKEAFCGRHRDPASIKQFHRFRLRVIWNKPMKADA